MVSRAWSVVVVKTVSQQLTTDQGSTNQPIKPDGPRSDSRSHRVGLSVRSTARALPHEPMSIPTSGLGPMLSADDSRPGPASARSAWASPCGRAHTDGCPRARASRPLTQDGVAERFPDWTAVGFRSSITAHRAGHAWPCAARAATSRTLFLGSPRPSRPIPGSLWRAGSGAPLVGGLSPHGADAPLAATLTRSACRAPRRVPISSGWPSTGFRPPGGLLRRRWPPTSALPALGCFAGSSLQGSRSRFWEPFSNSAGHFRVRRREEMYARVAESRKKSARCWKVIHRRDARCW